MDVLSRTHEPRSEQAIAPPRARQHGWLLAIVVIGAIVRLWGLGSTRFSYDEAFTAMAGRMPLGSMFAYLCAQDSHPPLDYLFHLPLARLGVGEFLYRLPSALCSIAALGLFAWWMRNRGRAGVFATVVFALSGFLVLHGRVARGYAELELLGVAIVVLADAWLRRPRRDHAPLLALLLFLALMTHVSAFLLGAGLFALAGLQRDRHAWRWRAAVAAAGLGWAALWGSSFLVQSGGGHSDWIPRTTPTGVVKTLASLTTGSGVLAVVVVGAVVTGGVLLIRRDRIVAHLWWTLFGGMVALAALAGLVLPVLLDRTLTLVAWGPALALGVLVDVLWTRARPLAVVASIAILAALVVPTFGVLTDHTGVTTGFDRLAAVVRPGDVAAVRPAGKFPELQWNVGVRGPAPWRPVNVDGRTGVAGVAGVALLGAPPSGRIWVLDWNSRLVHTPGYARCAPDWHFGRSRVVCLRATTQRVPVTPPT